MTNEHKKAHELANQMHELALKQSKFIDELLEQLKVANERLELLIAK